MVPTLSFSGSPGTSVLTILALMRTDIASSRRVRTASFALMLGMLLAALEQTVVATALPTIAGDLHDTRNFPWIVTAYLLALSVTMPLYGKLGDLYGRKSGYLAAILLFVIGSILCGLVQNIEQLIASRAVQGLGGGGLIVGAQAIITDLVSPRNLARYQAYMGAVFGVASVVGPVAGGLITEHASWRWLFLINLPLGAVALVVSAIAIPRTRPGERGRIDWSGVLLLGAALACLTLVASWGGSQHPWDSFMVLSLAGGVVVLVLVFLAVERQMLEPVVPLRLFRVGTFSISLGISVIEGFAMFGAVTFLPLFLQLGSGASVTASGLLLVPMIAGLLVASRIAAQIIARTGHYRWSARVGTALIAISFWLLSTMDGATSRLTSSGYLVLLGVGLGLTMPVVVVATQSSVPRRDVGTATAALTLGRSIGGSFGVSVFGAIFSATLNNGIAERLPANSDVATLAPSAVDSLPPMLLDELRAATGAGLVDVLHVALPFLVVAFLLTLMMRSVPLRDTIRDTP